MTHIRKQIRDAVVTAVTGLATTGTNVHQSRAQTIAAGALPALFIYTIEEASEIVTQTRPRRIERLLTVAVEIAVEETAAIDDKVDQIAAEIEVAMAADVTFGGLVKTSFLAGTEVEFDESGAKPVAGARLSYTVLYSTVEGLPEATA